MMNFANSDFSGIWVPLITPFTDDGSVDVASLQSLVRELVSAKVNGFVIFGTTGEPASLNDAEKLLVVQTVLACCASKPLMIGISAITPSDVCKQLQRWSAYSLAGFLITPPYYVRPSQQGIVEFYREIANATTLPIIVYDIPYRTGVRIDLATMRVLAAMPAIRAIKDCGGDAHKTQSLIAAGQLQVLSGEDHLVFTILCQGGAGAIAASAHLHTDRFVELYNAMQVGKWHRARALHHLLAPMIDALYAEPSPAPLKSVLAHLGRLHSKVRLPLVVATPEVARRANQAYEQAGNRITL